MVLFTIIARVADAMFLVGSMERAKPGSNLDEYRQEARMLLRKLGATSRLPSKLSIESGKFTHHYIVEEEVCYLTLTEKSYPRGLAFRFLEDVRDSFVSHLRTSYGNKWLDKIRTVDRPYQFIKFDRYIERLRREYADPSNQQNTKRLKEELAGVQTIMRKNIDDIISRGAALEDLSKSSSKLVQDSRRYYSETKKLNLMVKYKKYIPFAVLGLFLLFLIWYKFF